MPFILAEYYTIEKNNVMTYILAVGMAIMLMIPNPMVR